MSSTHGGGHKHFWGRYLKQIFQLPIQSHHSSLSLSELVLQAPILKDIKVRLWVFVRDQTLTHLCVDISPIP